MKSIIILFLLKKTQQQCLINPKVDSYHRVISLTELLTKWVGMSRKMHLQEPHVQYTKNLSLNSSLYMHISRRCPFKWGDMFVRGSWHFLKILYSLSIIYMLARAIAQLVRWRSANPGVVRSIPCQAT